MGGWGGEREGRGLKMEAKNSAKRKHESERKHKVKVIMMWTGRGELEQKVVKG